MKFRKGDGVAETVYIAFLLALMLLAVYGYSSGFDPNPAWASVAFQKCWPLGGLLLIPLFFDRNPKYRLSRNPRILITVGPGMYAVLALFSHGVISHGGPAAHAIFFGHSFESEARVVKFDKEKRRRGSFLCRHKVVAKDMSRKSISYKLCVERQVLEQVSEGAELVLSGKETKFGRLVANIDVQT